MVWFLWQLREVQANILCCAWQEKGRAAVLW